MIPFLSAIIGMPTWAWKLLGGAALIAACMFMIKCYGDSKVAEGKMQERLAKWGDMERQLLANQEIAVQELTKLRQENEKGMAASKAAEYRILAEISDLERQLTRKLAELAAVRSQRDTEIDAMPPAALPTEILIQSKRLAEQPQPPD